MHSGHTHTKPYTHRPRGYCHEESLPDLRQSPTATGGRIPGARRVRYPRRGRASGCTSDAAARLVVASSYFVLKFATQDVGQNIGNSWHVFGQDGLVAGNCYKQCNISGDDVDAGTRAFEIPQERQHGDIVFADTQRSPAKTPCKIPLPQRNECAKHSQICCPSDVPLVTTEKSTSWSLIGATKNSTMCCFTCSTAPKPHGNASSVIQMNVTPEHGGDGRQELQCGVYHRRHLSVVVPAELAADPLDVAPPLALRKCEVQVERLPGQDDQRGAEVHAALGASKRDGGVVDVDLPPRLVIREHTLREPLDECEELAPGQRGAM